MRRRPGRSGRHRVRRRAPTGLAGAALAVALLVVGVVLLGVANHHRSVARANAPGTSASAPVPDPSPASPAPASPAPASPARAPSTSAPPRSSPGTPSPALQAPAPPTRAAAGPAVPVRVQIPAIEVDSSLEPLGLARDGSLEPPTKFGVAGYYAGGPRPGAVGPAVITGHVDSVSGPAVFYRLRHVAAGDHVIVTTKAGQRLTFVVTGLQHYTKTSFPTSSVYGPSALPELKLVTCFGRFDFVHRSYLDNLVVSAVLAGPVLG